jgi:hypothetical protein
MNGYICFGPKSQRVEVYAETSYAAQKEAAKRLKIPEKKGYTLSVNLVEKDGVPVIHSTAEV